MKFQAFSLKYPLGWQPYYPFSQRYVSPEWHFSSFPASQRIVVVQGVLYYPDSLMGYLLMASESKHAKIRAKAQEAMLGYFKLYEFSVVYSNNKGQFTLPDYLGYTTFLFCPPNRYRAKRANTTMEMNMSLHDLSDSENTSDICETSLQKLLLFNFNENEFCIHVDFFRKYNEISIIQRIDTPHYDFLEGQRIRLHVLQPQSIVEILTIKPNIFLHKKVSLFFSSLLEKTKYRFFKKKQEYTLEFICMIYKYLYSNIKSFIEQNNFKLQELLDTLAIFLMKEPEPLVVTCIRQCMQIIAHYFGNSYFVKGGKVEDIGYFDVPSTNSHLLVFSKLADSFYPDD